MRKRYDFVETFPMVLVPSNLKAFSGFHGTHSVRQRDQKKGRAISTYTQACFVRQVIERIFHRSHKLLWIPYHAVTVHFACDTRETVDDWINELFDGMERITGSLQQSGESFPNHQRRWWSHSQTPSLAPVSRTKKPMENKTNSRAFKSILGTPTCGAQPSFKDYRCIHQMSGTQKFTIDFASCKEGSRNFVEEVKTFW